MFFDEEENVSLEEDPFDLLNQDDLNIEPKTFS
jgi:hypothetical protein